MLDIIITHYREPWEVCRKMFWMLDLQRCIDWGQIRVTVINDGGQHIPEKHLEGLSFPVNQVDIPHGGISAARNAGIDSATEPWMMFCDCDDTFANIYALRDVMNVLSPKREEQFDMMWGNCCEEDYIEGAELLYLMPRNKVFVFCHGKVYRRQFLIDENIRFDESLTFNEDSLFNAVIIARTPHTRIGEIKSHAPIYAWIRRTNSVTTGDNANDDGAYCQFRRNLKVTEENRLHREWDNYCGMVTRTAYDCYYMLFGGRISLKCKRRIYDEFVPWITERVNECQNVSLDILNQIREVSRMELLDEGESVPDSHEQVKKWIENTVKGVVE